MRPRIAGNFSSVLPSTTLPRFRFLSARWIDRRQLTVRLSDRLFPGTLRRWIACHAERFLPASYSSRGNESAAGKNRFSFCRDSSGDVVQVIFPLAFTVKASLGEADELLVLTRPIRPPC